MAEISWDNPMEVVYMIFFVTISLESMMIPLHSTTLLSLDWFEEKIQEAPVFNVKIFP